MAMSEHVKTLDGSNFQSEVLESSQPVLVDFSATWCGPCKMMAPIVDDVAQTYADKLKVGVVDIDQSSDIAVKYGVSAVPTFLLFHNGEVVDTAVGAVSKPDLVAKVTKLLPAGA